MASVAYSLHQVSPSPLREQREASGIHMSNSPSIDSREYRAASQDKAEKENVGSSHTPRPDVDPVRTVAPSCSTVLSEGETGARNAV